MPDITRNQLLEEIADQLQLANRIALAQTTFADGSRPFLFLVSELVDENRVRISPSIVPKLGLSGRA